ncbi:MAG: hypothetical protein A3H06_01780 [Candidatus Colwellbacteria bacterium RIFCSPLOWO2_12_FULL_44_13]|uniref:WxL domain-containing protein n=3 Tax=Candidatus Colwelliibacteriota TaxID=1817904 RepID=A0A1G1Z7K9_9BACT|nr:MAG: hypothetical protein A3F24_00340 [Candidatus Colwellbacteria bacterium RIFCSPHIGHO2_12_FULL_44_17]OGY60623.1 MAG: hypothetical protein A3I31_00895 [Candidatus Colwellbacteria bacterium RIFCSPLOWO2_02_FULL_44_20b]OGY61899.1 MAG: hypothetical protein A3H06_01780 [Candidatus Colwellbacteria bacterium RIFCSPLOWO2_12_FULL_44_13]
MQKLIGKLLGRLNIAITILLVMLVTGGLGSATYVLASSTSNFTQAINPGTLSTDIVDASYVSVTSPAVAMAAATFSFSCQTKTGTLGTTTEQIYVANPDAADTSWSLGLAPANTTDVWDSAGTDFDFNDPTGSGCTDGADADSVGGQMTVDPSGASIAQGSSANGTTGVSVGTSGSYSEGVTNSVVLMSSDGTIDIGDWTLQGVSISQKIPAEQPAASDYDISMVLTVSGS